MAIARHSIIRDDSRLADAAGWRPGYVELVPPCAAGCPAGQDVRTWLKAAASGAWRQAWDTIMAHHPLPATLGRVCYHSCESACNRANYDEAVAIHAVERRIGDHGIEAGWSVAPGAPTGRQVLVVGAGPAGLAAAYHLARQGHGVTIAEAAAAAGGMLRFAIPAYRLPRAVLEAEIARILAMGVTLKTNAPVDDLPAAMAAGGFDACFLAVGARIARSVAIEGSAPERVLDALAFLNGVATGAAPPRLGGRVAIYGGGNTAIDAARTALRLGAAEVRIIYRRTREKMPAHASEIRAAHDEGAVLHELTTIRRFDAGALTLERMALDGTGWPRPTGELSSLGIDTVILALGQEVDPSCAKSLEGVVVNRDGTVEVDADGRTAHRGVFAGGDMVPGERTVTVAIGHGQRAARAIDAWLGGKAPQPEAAAGTASFDRLHLWYYDHTPAAAEPLAAPEQRRRSFAEIAAGLDAAAARREAGRCLSCGQCLECDTCVAVCPSGAVRSLGRGEGFAIDRQGCTVCGLCVAECPCGAVQMLAGGDGERAVIVS